MTNAALWIGVGVVVGVVLFLVVFYIHILRRGRRIGTRGVFQRSRLTCSKCGTTFDFDWFPGGSFTAVRLGKVRYMSCPVCHRWSTFNIYDTMIARTPPSSGVGAPTDPSAPPK